MVQESVKRLSEEEQQLYIDLEETEILISLTVANQILRLLVLVICLPVASLLRLPMA